MVLDGEVDHEDTAGNGGRIGAGDVQWMTAGSGLLHKEMHSPEFTRRGGRFHALQLWVNLPAKSKMTRAALPDIDRRRRFPWSTACASSRANTAGRKARRRPSRR